jgi:hypothetical protein
MAGASAEVEQLETWFVRRGVPHFIVDYSASTDIWTRAIPVLVPAYLLVGLNALDLRDRSVGWNLAAAAMVVAVLAATWAITNRVRSRPMFAAPTQVGPAEIAVFLVGPLLPPLLVGQWGDAFQSITQGVAVLGVIYLAPATPCSRCSNGRSGAPSPRSRSSSTRSSGLLPLLLLVITFLFVNAEVWQVAGRLRSWPYAVVVGLFVVFGVLFVLSRVPGLIAELAQFDDWADVRTLADGTPAEDLAARWPTGSPAVVGECLVALGHLLHVVATLHRGAETVGGVHQLAGEALGHRLLTALGG